MSSQLKSERIGFQASDAQVTEHLAELSGWEAVDGAKAICRTFELPSFNVAIAFLNYVAELASAADHYPDLAVRGKQVTVTLSSVDTGGLTEKDFEFAASIRR